ncbi:MAG: DUF3990 domain-containing protein [Bifidobacteriaceae bacterium]|jgi:hypothetical protein|nr:DUF3990 domain-containing protein [Bifidobacteriaceae bacterium]
MRLYHGPATAVAAPDTSHSHRRLDFGPGFYLTSFENQARRWAARKALRVSGRGTVSVYDFQAELDGHDVLRFDRPTGEWVDLVCACRRGEPVWEAYDAVFGPVADDKVYVAVDLYAKGIWDMARTLAALKFYESSDQVCVRSQRLLDEQLVFLQSYEVNT